jgi:catechol 1,2-dioxygenase
MQNQRLVEFFEDLIREAHTLIEKHRITHDEYRQAVGFLVAAGQAGEIPLLMDLFLESKVDEVAHADHRGSPTAIEGPFYLPDAPLLERPYVLPMRVDEPGDVLFFTGTVRATDGAPLAGAMLDVWQADAQGEYSGFSEIPPPNLRGRFTTDAEGRFEVRTVVPRAYEIPKAGPTGRLLAALGRHAWRPAHLHVKLTHDSVAPMTSQLYFEGDRWLDSDVANAVKPGLVVTLDRHADPRDVRSRGLDGPYLIAHYDFVLQARTPVPMAATAG